MRAKIHILFFAFALIIGSNSFALSDLISPESTDGTCSFNLSSGTTLQFCYSQREHVFLDIFIENEGLDTLSNLNVGWLIGADQNGSTFYGANVSPNSTGQFALPEMVFSNGGSFDVTIWVDASCGGSVTLSDTIMLTVVIRSPFEIDALSDTVSCLNTQIPLTVPGGYSNYDWSTGATTNTITVNQSGLYVVTVTDDFGCEAVDSMGLGNFRLPDDMLGDTVVCDGVILTSDLVTGFTSYVWSTGSHSPNIQISQPGIYWVRVVDTNNCNLTDTMEVVYAIPPNPGAPDVLSVCAGDTAIIGAATNYTSYTWNTGATTSSIPVFNSGVYIITVVGPFGCIGIDTIQVNVTPLPDILFNDSVMCNGASYVMGLGQWFPDVEWSTGDTTQNLLVTSPGQYSVTVTDLLGCQSVDTIDIINIDVNMSLGMDDTICTGAGLFLIPSGSFDTYLWSDGSTGNSITVNSTGVYALTVTLGQCSNFDDVSVLVEDYPVANFSYMVNSPDIQLTNLSNQSWGLIWDFGDSTTSTALNPFHQYVSNGSYTVTLKVENTCGNDIESILVGIFPQGTQNIYESEELKIFPTLATSQIQFTLDGSGKSRLEYSVYDVVGKLLFIKSEDYFGPDYLYQINISQFAAGTYYLRIVSDDELIAVKPFIKN